MIRELLTDPEAYFEERVKYPRVRTQLILVVIAGIAANLWRPVIITELGAASIYVDDVLLIFTIAGVLEFLLWWFVLTGIMLVVANLLGGDGRFAELFRLTGYGFLPIIASGLIWSAGYYWVLRTAAPPEAPRQPGFQYEYEIYTDYFAQVATDPLLLAVLGVGSVFVLAAGYLWTVGVTVVASLERDRAAVAVAPVLLVLLVWTFFRPF